MKPPTPPSGAETETVACESLALFSGLSDGDLLPPSYLISTLAVLSAALAASLLNAGAIYFWWAPLIAHLNTP